MILYYSIHACAFLLALGYGFLAAKRDPELDVENALPRSKGLLIFSIFLLLAAGVALAAQFHDPVCAALPLWIQRYVSWIKWGILSSLGGIVSGYALSLGLVRKHEQRRMLCVAVVLLNVATGLSSFRFLRPLAPQMGKQSMRGAVVLQSENSTCGAATLANIAQRFGIILTEKKAAELLMTSRLGTEIGPIRYGLHQLGLGFETLVPKEIDSLSDVSAPAFLFVDHPSIGEESHAVAYMGKLGDGYEIWDPLVGKLAWDDETVTKIWHGNGIAVRER